MEIQSDNDYHRKALALLVCFFIAFIYVESVVRPYYQPAPAVQPQTAATDAQPAGAPLAAQSAQTAAIAPAPASTTPAGVAAPAAGQESPTDAQLEQAGFADFRTHTIQGKISLLGGRVRELRLNDYRETLDKNSPGYNMITHGGQATLPLGVTSGDVNDVWTTYRLVSSNQSIDATTDGPQQVVLEGTLPDQRVIKKTMKFEPHGYFVDVDVEVGAPPANGKALSLEWIRFVAQHDTSLLDPYNVQGYTWFDGQKALRQTFNDFTDQTLELGQVKWVSLGDKYFAASLITADEKNPARAIRKTGDQVYRAQIDGGPTHGAFRVLAGPKSYRMLSEAGDKLGLERNIEFGMFGMIAAPLLSLLSFFFGVFKNYGLAIVTLTILVRLALYPLNSASFKQMKAMQDLKPEMDRIRDQFKDRQEQQVQLMALYKKNGVNPIGGCLPVLLQMPVFLGLYSGLMLAVELRHAHFALWIHDLSGPEALMIGNIGIPVMVILFVISMIVQQMTTPSQMDPVQKKMMMVMPVFLGFMFASFPSGLTLYWLTSNLISIGQQKGLYMAHDGGKSALKITLAVSLCVFILAYVVTLF